MQVASRFNVGNQPFQLDDSNLIFGRSRPGQGGTSVFTENGAPINTVQVKAQRTRNSTAGAMTMIFDSMFGVSSGDEVADATSGFRCVDVCFVLDRSSSMKLGITEDSPGLTSTDPRFLSPPNPLSRWLALDRAIDGFIDEFGTGSGETRVSIVTYGSDFSFSPYFWPATSIDLPMTTNVLSAKSTMTNDHA